MNKRRFLLLAFVVFVSMTASGCGYNTLQSKQQNVKAKWADIENQLQRRADLIPNLFEAAKAAGVQEQQVFGDIAAARTHSCFKTGGSLTPCNISAGANSAAKLVKLSPIKSVNFSIEADAGM